MSRVNYTGYIAGSLCKSIRHDKRAPVLAFTRKKPDRAVCFDFVMSHYADEVARMRAGMQKGDV